MKVVDILGADGLVAKRLTGYEHRPEQLEMAAAVERAMAESKHLLVEAGTGVGKSFAYLAPVIQRVTSTKARAVISTHTIALQEQLIERDIPFLNAVWPDEFTAVLVKGRNNYLGIRRLKQASEKQRFLFDTDGHRQELWRIEDWAYGTQDGSLSDLSPTPDPLVWELVRSEHDNCMGKSCEFYEQCFYQKSRRRTHNAQILVVNHAILMSDLALRRQGASILPDYDVAIIDEAHTLESVAADYLGRRVSEAQVRYLLNRLYNDRADRGFLKACDAPDAIRATQSVRSVANRFWSDVRDWAATDCPSNGRITAEVPLDNDLSDALRALTRNLRIVHNGLKKEEELFELNSLIGRAGAFADELDLLVGESSPEAVRWVEGHIALLPIPVFVEARFLLGAALK